MTVHEHWKSLTNPDYLGAYAFEKGEEKTVVISELKQDVVTGTDGNKSVCLVAVFADPDVKPMIVNRTNAKTIEKLFGTGYLDEWVGKAITLVVRNVRAFGDTVPALRVKPEVPRPPVCADCKKPVQAYKTMNPWTVAKATGMKYGRPLCSECAAHAKEAAQTKGE